MPRLVRHARKRHVAAEQKVIEWLSDPGASPVLYLPSDAPSDWPPLLVKDVDDPTKACDLLNTHRFFVDVGGELVIEKAVGLESYTNAEGVPCRRPVWPS